MKHKQLKANITAVGRYLPENILTNFDLEKMVDTNDEWIRTRTGIAERRVVSKGQASVDMSLRAIQQILDSRNLNPEEIDTIIVGTVTPDMIFPSCAAIIQNKIGAKNAWGYDLSAACSGFLFALQSGASLIESGQSKKVIVVGVDTMSSILNYKDRNTCILFGDGAGAAILSPVKEGGILSERLYSDGNEADILKIESGGSKTVVSEEQLKNPNMEDLKKFFHCDTLLRKQGLLYFCRLIEDVEFEEITN